MITMGKSIHHTWVKTCLGTTFHGAFSKVSCSQSGIYYHEYLQLRIDFIHVGCSQSHKLSLDEQCEYDKHDSVLIWCMANKVLEFCLPHPCDAWQFEAIHY